MKVLLVNTLYYPYKLGGAEKSVQALAENLVLSGLEVAVITLGEETKYFELNGVSIWSLQLQNKYWPFSGNRKSKVDKLIWHLKDLKNKDYTKDIIKIINSFKPNLIHTNNLSGFSINVWSIAKKLKIKVIHTLRDYYLQCPSVTKFKNNKVCINRCNDCYCLSIIKKKVSRDVDCVVGISDFILKDHMEEGYFLDSQKEVIYNGFRIDINEKTKEITQRKNKIVFGFIGQIIASKGIELLLESFNNLSEFDNWSLVIAGRINDDYKKQLFEICSSDKIEFLGYIDNDLFYENIDVLVVPSLWNEPFGRVVLEGVIRGKVVLGSDTGGIPELLKNNRNFIFKPTPKELTTVLTSLLNNPKKLDTFKLDYSFLSQFNIQKTILSYKTLYTNIMEK